jgi:hypothetical protein
MTVARQVVQSQRSFVICGEVQYNTVPVALLYPVVADREGAGGGRSTQRHNSAAVTVRRPVLPDLSLYPETGWSD